MISFKRILYNYFLKKKLKDQSVERNNLNFSDVKQIAFLFDASEPANYIVLQKYIKQYRSLGKKVDLLGYFDLNKVDGDLNFPYFSRNDLNYFLQPKKNLLDHFMNKEYDFLINAYVDENLPLEYVSTFSKAKFRIGLFKKEKAYYADLFISNGKAKSELESLLDEIDHYLKAIKTYEK